MADGFSASAGEIVVIGGGCYGTFYARQLERARARGALTYERVLLVDRDPECQASRELASSRDRQLVTSDWSAFLDEWLARPRGADNADAIVPSPLMPHLMYEWIVRRAGHRWPGRTVRSRPLDTEAGTPYDMPAPDGTRYLSHADWLCPTHCVEPAICPATRAPRTWEMADTVAALVPQLARMRTTAGPVIFNCRHRAYGVGMFDVVEVLGGDALVAGAGAGGAAVDVVIATVSSCHGAASLLALGPLAAV